MGQRTAIVAFGGNALIESGEPGFQLDQIDRAEDVAKALLPYLEANYGLVLVHGNGPQVGNALIRVEEAATKVPPLSLDACVAETQGSIGYFLDLGFRNVLADAGLSRPVATIVTLVEVDPADPGLTRPEKPIGPFYSSYRVHHLLRMFEWQMVEDAGRGYRRIVPSPRPVRVLNGALVRSLVDAGVIVVAGGGGGIPIACLDGRFTGIEAVIDKDRTARLLADEVDADTLLMLTAVDHVSLDFGTDRERPLSRVTVRDAEAHLAAGQFPKGSMGPKMEACFGFVRERGGSAIITSVSALGEALAGRAGTRIFPDDELETES
jgi:carbamate kinase